MTRLHPAAPSARTLRALIGTCAVLVLAVAASGCANGAPAAPTPDPFVGLADRSDQAFRQGLESYGQGQYRDALTSFEQARLLSPTVEARIDQMIERSRAALAPKPTAVPPEPTDVPATPVATQVARASQAPDTELGRRYFGNVSLGVVPGRDTDASAATQFFFQDQIGLHIDGLQQHSKLPFTLRVFNLDSGHLVAEVQSEDAASPQPTSVVQPTALPALGGAANAAATAAPTATPTASEPHLVRFGDTFVWYHEGGEAPGRYVVQLFANGVLTNNLEYTVGSVPIAVPTPTAVLVQAEPTLVEVAAPTDVPIPAAAPASQGRTSLASPAAAAVAPVVAPTSIPEPTPIVVPTPARAFTTVVGGVPAGLDVDPVRGRFYVADASGIIWTTDAPTGQEHPTLGTPIHIGDRQPVDLAVDSSSGYLYLSTRKCAPVAPGCIVVVDPRAQPDGSAGAVIASISLPAAPGDLRLDPDYGLLYVALPAMRPAGQGQTTLGAIAQVSVRSQTVVRIIDQLPQITSLAIDPLRHTLYASHLAGQLSVIDVPSGQVTARVSLTGAGLTSVATARGLAYAVNTVTHELAVVEPLSQAVTLYPLSQEPAAVAASEDSGAVFVLSSRARVIVRIDPTSGVELGRVVLSDRSGHSSALPGDLQALRSRLVLNTASESVYATLPEAGSLAAVSIGTFPLLAREIPRLDAPDQPAYGSIPGLIRPGAEPLPAESSPVLQAQESAPDANTEEEGL